MTTTARIRISLVVFGLVAAGCGGGSDDATSATTPPTTDTEAVAPETSAAPTTPPTTEVEATTPPTTEAPIPTTEVPTTEPAPSGDLCEALDGEEPPADFASIVPAEHVAAAQLIGDVVTALDDLSSLPSDVIERFIDPESAAALTDFADAAEVECGPGDGVDGLRYFAGISELGAPPADPAYCVPLTEIVALESDDDATAAALETAISLAPSERVPGLEVIQSLINTDAVPDGFDPSTASQAIAGLGLYAEARCGVADAFASMILVGAFLSDPESLDGMTGDSGAGLGAVPDPADLSAAQSAVPTGVDLSFEIVEIDLQDDGDYLVSAVVPSGWEADDSVFGTTFEPGAGFGIFTEISFDTGCDGMCEVNDWDARLNGPDGFITLYRADNEMIIDRSTQDTPGVVLVKPGFSDGIAGTVIRWADAADRYFVCDFELEEESIDLVDAFVAACESSVPGWITAAA